MYLVRRYLYFGWDEWEALPGYQQRAYVAQLEKAKPWTTDGGDQDGKRPESGGGEMDVTAPMRGRIDGARTR